MDDDDDGDVDDEDPDDNGMFALLSLTDTQLQSMILYCSWSVRRSDRLSGTM